MPELANSTQFPVVEYPQRSEPETQPLDQIARAVLARIVAVELHLRPRLRQPAFIARAGQYVAELSKLSDEELKVRLNLIKPALRQALRRQRLSAAILANTFALMREIAKRTLGQSPYDVQLIAAYTMLTGQIAEMATGEGKSLSAMLAAGVLALGGTPVHVMTVNDYLAERDFERFSPFFKALGLSVGVVIEGQTPDVRRKAYACHVVYGTAKEIVFDYLRDRTTLRVRPGNLARKVDRILSASGVGPTTAPLVMRGLPAAIIDEADSVLLDQAGTPFILSGGDVHSSGLAPKVLVEAMALAMRLNADQDYLKIARLRLVELTDSGRQRLHEMTEGATDAIGVPAIREHAVCQALNAVYVFQRDRDYMVEDGKICIVDESTGRLMPDRTWSDGLHQMVELKEGVELTRMFETTARITLQKFFQRYMRLGGMTGTARSSAREIWEVYGLKIRPVPARQPDQRIWSKPLLLPTQAEKWGAIASLVRQLKNEGHPVLIGTKTVAASQHVSSALGDMQHVLLNASNAAEEAKIIAEAGEAGRVTVATNMAGRGTDILLTDAARASGGLHVILTELHDSRRVDLQLCGRCGRQGDPGRVIKIFSLQDDLLARRGKVLNWLATSSYRLGLPFIGVAILLLCQWREDVRQARGRTSLVKQEQQRDMQLAISGYAE